MPEQQTTRGNDRKKNSGNCKGKCDFRGKGKDKSRSFAALRMTEILVYARKVRANAGARATTVAKD
jgi:hypothetical protein